MALDVDRLRGPVSEDSPCGHDLTADPAYYELESAVRGKPEIQYGNMTQKAEEPDWADIEKRAEAFLLKSKDLRVFTYLAVAMLRRYGYRGLSDALAILGSNVGEFWDGLFPLLDPEDDNDPTERRNIIESLSPPEDTVDQFLRVRDHLLDAPLCESRRFGRVGLRNLLWASGEMPKTEEGGGATDEETVRAAFDDSEPETLLEREKVVAEALGHLDTLDACLRERIPDGSPSFTTLRRWLARASKEISLQVARRGLGGDEAGEAAVEGTAAGDLPEKGLAPARAAGGSAPGRIQSPDDVKKALDVICDYYARQEPSSPVPMLLRRARRLVGLGFADIIRDLSPEALSQIEVIGGPQETGNAS